MFKGNNNYFLNKTVFRQLHGAHQMKEVFAK